MIHIVNNLQTIPRFVTKKLRLGNYTIDVKRVVEEAGDLTLNSIHVMMNNIVVAKFGTTHVYPPEPFHKDQVFGAIDYATIELEYEKRQAYAVRIHKLLQLLDEAKVWRL